MSSPKQASKETFKLSGWITKRGAFIHSHKLRYGYLYADRLDYYDKPLPQGEMKGSWDIAHFSSVETKTQRGNHVWIRLVHESDPGQDRHFEPQEQCDQWLKELTTLLSTGKSTAQSASNENTMASQEVSSHAITNKKETPPLKAPLSPNIPIEPKSDGEETHSPRRSSSLARSPRVSSSFQSSQMFHRVSVQTFAEGTPDNETSHPQLGGMSHSYTPNMRIDVGMGNRSYVADEKCQVLITNGAGENEWKAIKIRVDSAGVSFPDFFIPVDRIRWGSLMFHEDLFDTDEDGRPVWTEKSGMPPFDTTTHDAIILSYWEEAITSSFENYKIDDLSFVSIPLVISRKKTKRLLDAIVWHSTRNWSWEYQELSELLQSCDVCENSEEVAFDYSMLLSNTIEDFELQAMHLVRAIVSEKHLPNDQKRVPCISKDDIGCDIFKLKNMIVKMSSNEDRNQTEGNTTSKMLSNEYRAGIAVEYALKKLEKNYLFETCTMYGSHDPKEGIFCALSCMIDYCGHRAVAMANPGIGYGESFDSGHTPNLTANEDSSITKWTTKCLHTMNIIKQNEVQEDQMYMYRFDFQFRPEFVQRYPISLPTASHTNYREARRDAYDSIAASAMDHMTKVEIPCLVELLTSGIRLPICQLMHFRGINLRFLGLVTQKILMTMSEPAKTEYLTELAHQMVRRSLKQEARKSLRQMIPATFISLSKNMIEFVNKYICSEDAADLWITLIQKKFELDNESRFLEPIDLMNLIDKQKLYQDLMDDTGVVLTERARSEHKALSMGDIKGFQALPSLIPHEIYDRGMFTLPLALPDSDSDPDSQLLPLEAREILLRVSAECFSVSSRQSGIFVNGLNMLGVCADKLGKKKTAIEHFQNLLLIQSLHSEALASLGDLYQVESSTLISIIYSAGALINGADYGAHVESMALRTMLNNLDGLPILFGLVKMSISYQKDLQSDSAELQDLEAILRNTDQLLQGSAFLAMNGDQHFQEQVDSIRQLLRSEKWLTLVSSSVKDTPFVILFLGLFNRVVEFLSDASLLSNDDIDVFSRELCADTVFVDSLFCILEGGVASFYSGISLHITTYPIIRFYTLSILVRVLGAQIETPSFHLRGLVQLESMVRLGSETAIMRLVLKGLCAVIEQLGARSILETHPHIKNSIANFLGCTDDTLAFLAWRTLRKFIQSKDYVQELCSTSISFIHDFAELSNRLLIECDIESSFCDPCDMLSRDHQINFSRKISEFVRFIIEFTEILKTSPQSLFIQSSLYHDNSPLRILNNLIELNTLKNLLLIASKMRDKDLVKYIVNLLWEFREFEGFATQLDKRGIKMMVDVSKEQNLDCSNKAFELMKLAME